MNTSAHLFSSPASNDRIRQYRRLLENFCSGMAEYGYQIRPYRDPLVRGFASLPEDKQISTLLDLNRYTTLYQMAIRQGIRPDNEAQLLWYAIRLHGYRPTRDLLDRVGDDDFIEVYNSDNIQIHRSFNYFRLSSYELDAIFVSKWWELYERDPVMEARILEVVQGIFTGKISGTLFAGISDHYLREAWSAERRVYRVSHDYFSPLFDKSNRPTAFVVLSKARIARPEEYPDRFKRE